MNKMRDRYKLQIGIFIVVILIILAIAILWGLLYYNTDKKRYKVTEYESREPIDPYNYLSEGEEFVSSNEAKVLQEEQKSLDQYNLLNFKMVIGEDTNRVLFEIRNDSDEIIPGQELIIYLYGKNHIVMDTINIYIPDISVGGSLAVNGITKVDLEQVVDYELAYMKS